MRKVLLVLFAIFVSGSLSAQNQLPNIDGIHVFAGLNVPTRNVDREQFKFDYMRLHVDLSNSEIKVQFRHDFSSGKLQLANVSKTFGDLTITAGRFLDPVWWLYPAPHTMSQTSYPVSVNTFTVLNDGIGATYVTRDFRGKQTMTFYVSVFDCNGTRNISASIDALGIFGAFIQTRGTETGFGLIARGKIHPLVNLEGGVVRRPEKMENMIAEFYIQNQAIIMSNFSVWLQANFLWQASYMTNDESIVPAKFESSRVMAGATYQYSKNSHVKLFYNLIDKVAVAKITFFL